MACYMAQLALLQQVLHTRQPRQRQVVTWNTESSVVLGVLTAPDALCSQSGCYALRGCCHCGLRRSKQRRSGTEVLLISCVVLKLDHQNGALIRLLRHLL